MRRGDLLELDSGRYVVDMRLQRQRDMISTIISKNNGKKKKKMLGRHTRDKQYATDQIQHASIDSIPLATAAPSPEQTHRTATIACSRIAKHGLHLFPLLPAKHAHDRRFLQWEQTGHGLGLATDVSRTPANQDPIYAMGSVSKCICTMQLDVTCNICWGENEIHTFPLKGRVPYPDSTGPVQSARGGPPGLRVLQSCSMH